MKARIILLLLLFFAASAPAAQRGNLASVYFLGWGVKRDYAQAMKLWFKLKAAGALPPASTCGLRRQRG